MGRSKPAALDGYLAGIEEGLKQWDATMHFMGNQYIELDGDTGRVESWVVGYHMEAPGSPLDHLVLGLRYQDEVVRVAGDLEDHPPRHGQAVAHRSLPAAEPWPTRLPARLMR